MQVTYKYIALSPAVERFIAGFSANVYDEHIAGWRSWLANCFRAKNRGMRDSPEPKGYRTYSVMFRPRRKASKIPAVSRWVCRSGLLYEIRPFLW